MQNTKGTPAESWLVCCAGEAGQHRDQRRHLVARQVRGGMEERAGQGEKMHPLVKTSVA